MRSGLRRTQYWRSKTGTPFRNTAPVPIVSVSLTHTLDVPDIRMLRYKDRTGNKGHMGHSDKGVCVCVD